MYRYLVSGDQILSIALAYRIGESTARNIIKETCEVLVKVLQPIFLRTPNQEEWRHICASFLEKWQFPNCAGALDGKHFDIQAPRNSGSQYFNYKKSFSEVLFAACDANYIFTLVHVGEIGSNSGAAIFANSPIGQQIRDRGLDLPNGVAPLPGSNLKTPCCFVGDDAFPLSTRLMKPYSGHYLPNDEKIFNYRLSRARRVIENAFGILTSRFLVFRSPIALHPKSVDKIILAAICLHNFLKIRDDQLVPSQRLYCPPKFVDWEDDNGVRQCGDWRQLGARIKGVNVPADDLLDVPEDAINMRNRLKEYILTPAGKVP